MSTSAKYWREMPQRYRYEASKCKKCGKLFFPPRLICDKCQNRDFETFVLPEEGLLVSYTVIRVSPDQFSDEAPYAIGIIDCGNDLKITSQVVDCEPDELKIGMKLKREFRLISEEGVSGILCYGYKYVPIRQ